MKKISFALVLTLIICFLTSCQCSHTSWSPATCTSAKQCLECGTTEGSPLNHNWINATCKSPKKCSACGMTEGSPLNHNWINATCKSPKKCSACGTTEGTYGSHIFSSNGICQNCGDKNIADYSIRLELWNCIDLLVDYYTTECQLIAEYGAYIAMYERLNGSYTKYNYPSEIKKIADSYQEWYKLDFETLDEAIEICSNYYNLSNCKKICEDMRYQYQCIANETFNMNGIENMLEYYNAILQGIKQIQSELSSS